MLSRVSTTITSSAYRSSMPTVVEHTFVLNAWGLVNLLTHLLMNGNENVTKKTKGCSDLIRASAGSGSEPFWSQGAAFWVSIANTDLLTMPDIYLYAIYRDFTQFTAECFKAALSRLKHVFDLSILSVFGFRSNRFNLLHISIMCNVFDMLWTQVWLFMTAVWRWVGASIGQSQPQEFKRFKAFNILSRTCKEKCEEIPPARRTESL